MSTRHFLLRAEDVADGAVVGRTVDDIDVAVCRVDGELRAVADACTHYKWPLSKGFVHEGRLYCSLHMAAFDPATGECVEPPASCPVKTYALEVEDGSVYILLEEPVATPARTHPAPASAPSGVRPLGPPGWAERRAQASSADDTTSS